MEGPGQTPGWAVVAPAPQRTLSLKQGWEEEEKEKPQRWVARWAGAAQRHCLHHPRPAGGAGAKASAASEEAAIAMVTIVTWQLSRIVLGTCCLFSGAADWLWGQTCVQEPPSQKTHVWGQARYVWAQGDRRAPLRSAGTRMEPHHSTLSLFQSWE
ncbi:hypothetical protein P7K49_002333 [Saguinus oedipus]|uniref:Uncharacterized protein n=1 Tax=Saguinus oedipus TaxID=9490 RepID=A0ABQ9WH26_SAGOE|nr:hypothetical protein P7K49_002333 [Saguinus oedipus]